MHTLLAGQVTNLNLTGDINNTGTVAGRSNPGGTLVASAGRDAKVIAGLIANSGAKSDTTVKPGNAMPAKSSGRAR